MIQITETDNFLQICDYQFQLNSPRNIKECITNIDCYFIEGVIGEYETTTNNIVYTNLEELIEVMNHLLNQNINGYYRILFKKRHKNQKKLTGDWS